MGILVHKLLEDCYLSRTLLINNGKVPKYSKNKAKLGINDNILYFFLGISKV